MEMVMAAVMAMVMVMDIQYSRPLIISLKYFLHTSMGKASDSTSPLIKAPFFA